MPTTSRHCRSDTSPPRRYHSSLRNIVSSAVSTKSVAESAPLKNVTGIRRYHDRATRDVASRACRIDERIDIHLAQIGDHVDIVCGSWFTMNRAGERTPTTYETPIRAKELATRRPTAMGSARESGAITPAVCAIDQIISQSQSREPRQEFTSRFLRMPGHQTGERKLVCSQSQLAHSPQLLAWSHRRVQLSQHRANVGGGVVERRWAKHGMNIRLR